jgi:hypothetical protein
VSKPSTHPAAAVKPLKADETRERIHLRACALALINGRPPGHIAQADYEQARRELMGKRDLVHPE